MSYSSPNHEDDNNNSDIPSMDETVSRGQNANLLEIENMLQE
jgi:hypothetical protein